MQKASTLKLSRLQGVLRYFTGKSVVVALTVFVVMCVGTLIGMAMAAFAGIENPLNGVSGMYSANSIVLIVLCATAAKSETRFLAIAPTPRWSIYLGILWKITCYALVGTLLAALHTFFEVFAAQTATAMGLVNMPVEVYDWNDLWGSITRMQGMDIATSMGDVAKMILPAIPGQVVNMVIGMGAWYLYMCLFTRWKMPTLAVTIGVPVLLVTMVIVPFAMGWMDKIMSMSQNDLQQMMPVVFELLRLVENVGKWMYERWPIVRTTLGVVCWLLAYPVMRGTPQPTNG